MVAIQKLQNRKWILEVLKSLIKKGLKQGLGVRVACHRFVRHRLAYTIQTTADESFTKTNL
jgi:hypothetical protein